MNKTSDKYRKSSRFNIRLTATEKKKIEVDAERLQITVTEWFREAIEDKLKKGENEKMNTLKLTIEMLNEMGKVALDGDENINELQNELRKNGIETRFVSTDREYLIKI